jgi:hypothetical protein
MDHAIVSCAPLQREPDASWAAEPSIGEMLADPVVQALMAADGVDAKVLAAQLTAMASRLPRAD